MRDNGSLCEENWIMYTTNFKRKDGKIGKAIAANHEAMHLTHHCGFISKSSNSMCGANPTGQEIDLKYCSCSYLVVCH